MKPLKLTTKNMNTKEFLSDIEQTFAECLKIAQAKNADYSTGTNPFKNFQSSEVVKVDPARAILVRMMDKMARVSNLLDKEADVKDESIFDTLNDIINYAAILKAYIKKDTR